MGFPPSIKGNEPVPAMHWNIRPFIDGRYQASTATDTFEHLNPATEQVLYRASAGSASDVDAAVASARKRFNEGTWSQWPPTRRAQVLLKLAELIKQHSSELALLDTLEMGKPIQLARADADQLSPIYLRSWAEVADKLVGASASLSTGMAFNIFEPRGVVGAITPWNFPVFNAVYKFGPALAAGNTMVLKPSELAPSSTLKLAELALEAGVPEGVMNVVPGLGSTVGVVLASHMDVDMISFTGSTATGRRIMESCGRSNGKPLLLECGGKTPQIVFDEIEDLGSVAEAVVQGFVWNQGQVCMSGTRLLVQETVKERLLEKVIGRAKQVVPGDPLVETTTFGPLASPGQRVRVKSYIQQGLKAGAVAVLKGEIRESGGCYVSPTIFDRVDNTMSIVREEIFGPVLCVQSFTTEGEAIALANATDYGLAAVVWTRDLGRGRRMAQAIRSGQIIIRTSGKCEISNSSIVLSFEAQKASGFGAELGLAGLKSYSTLKLVSFSGD